MAMFVHLAPASRVALIRRSGIRRVRRARDGFPGGVFAVPVTRNFYMSHQWLREMKRRNLGPLVGVYFRIPDRERVWLGHYGRRHRWMSATEAAGVFARAEDSQGWEVVIPPRSSRRSCTASDRSRRWLGGASRHSPRASGRTAPAGSARAGSTARGGFANDWARRPAECAAVEGPQRAACL